MIWELVFMLVILKIPVVYLCAVVWWAIRAEPEPLKGVGRLAPVTPTPPDCSWRARQARLRRRGPAPRGGARGGRPVRVASAHVRLPL